MITRYDQGMNTPNETHRPTPGRGPKSLTAEELLALPEYVLKRFEDLTRTDDPTEVKEVFEDFIAFAPDLARVVIDLTATVKRVEDLVDRLEHEAAYEASRGDTWDATCIRAEARRIRRALNGDDA